MHRDANTQDAEILRSEEHSGLGPCEGPNGVQEPWRIKGKGLEMKNMMTKILIDFYCNIFYNWSYYIMANIIHIRCSRRQSLFFSFLNLTF